MCFFGVSALILFERGLIFKVFLEGDLIFKGGKGVVPIREN